MLQTAPQPAVGIRPDALRCNGVSVAYGEVKALTDVSVGFSPGRIHAVVGQNGAGKTTFARVCAGLVAPQAGAVLVAGKPIRSGDVVRSRQAGIELVHQSFALPPSFTVAEVMEFGASGGGRVYTRKGLATRWQAHIEELGVKARPGDRIRDLPVETRQGVEIARALVSKANVLILDEPTAVLSPEGVDRLATRLRRLQQGCITVIVILHKIREVMALAETVTVLRGGRLVKAALKTGAIGADEIAAAIIGPATVERKDDLLAAVGEDTGGRSGKSRPAAEIRPGDPGKAGAAILSLRGVTTRPDSSGPHLRELDLDVGAGEIVGVAGVEGNGQRTLVDAIAGLVEVEKGTLALDGRDLTAAPLVERRRAGLRIVPFERNQEGLTQGASLWRNWAVRDMLRGGAFRLVRPAELQAACRASLEEWDVRFHSVEQPAGSLSGGNAQKTILAREVDRDARLLIAAQPTRGLDIGATSFVWDALRRLKARGAGVLLISSDLDELFDIADRIVVATSGQLVGDFRPPYDLAAVGAVMTGGAK